MHRDAAQRITLGLSVLLLVGLAALIIGLEVSRGEMPPQFRVIPDYEAATKTEGAWSLPVMITNTGDLAADAVRVDIVRPVAGEDPEIAELEFVFVAGGEQVAGVAVFDERPTAETIEIDVQSSTEP